MATNKRQDTATKTKPPEKPLGQVKSDNAGVEPTQEKITQKSADQTTADETIESVKRFVSRRVWPD